MPPALSARFRLSTFQEWALRVSPGAICRGTRLGPTDPRVGRTCTPLLQCQQRPLSSLSLVSKCRGRGGREAQNPWVSITGPAQKDPSRTWCPRPPALPTSALHPTHTRVLAMSRAAHWRLYQGHWPVTEEMKQPACRVDITQEVTLILKTCSGRISELGVRGLARS